MTGEEFFEHLKEIPFWKLMHGGKIRRFIGGRSCDYQYTCPLCAVAWKVKQLNYDVGKWYRAGEELQLNSEFVSLIQLASDNEITQANRFLRWKLMDVCKPLEVS